MTKYLKEAIKIFNQGGIVVFPTDTAIGIGCRIDNEKAIKRLYEIKKRPYGKPFPVLVSNLEMAQNYVMPIGQKVIDKLISSYWPGGLTIVLKSTGRKVSSLVTGGNDTIGVRMPNSPLILEIIQNLNMPILGPSANFSGEKTPFNTRDLDRAFIKKVDYIIPGTSNFRKPSTVIDCSETKWKILRFGAVDLDL